MHELWEWFIVGALALGFNATPVLAPPTAGLLAYFHLNHELNVVLLAATGALGATLGRMALALFSRALGVRLISEKRRSGISQVIEELQSKRSAALSYLALFAIGPIPKGALFIAVGLARLPLLPGALVFGVARFGIYLTLLMAADTASSSLGNLFSASLVGPLGVALQIGSIGALILIFRLDWRKLTVKTQQLNAMRLRIPLLRTLSRPAEKSL